MSNPPISGTLTLELPSYYRRGDKCVLAFSVTTANGLYAQWRDLDPQSIDETTVSFIIPPKVPT